MQIINKVEICYFRSVYRIELTDLGDINVVTGGNDCGKSNLLKALNLFFNNETELDKEFNFSDDFCRFRNEQVRQAKGKGMIWIRVTFNNFLNWKSLPPKFSVRRQWNRYDYSYQQTVSNDITSTVISKFLNKIAFHYVPAIRGRDIFSHYLTLLHDALIDDERAGLRKASEKLINEINTNTAEMTRTILSGIGISSVIQPPSDLRDLFYSLDFSTQHGSHYIPLIKRGDGIQAHHIPFILNFLSEKSDKCHIWAYEEPENSLEMGRCFELADHFEKIFAVKNQILLTTHSPAFYSIKGENLRRWIVQKSETEDGNWYSDAIPLESNDPADISLGIAALVSDRCRELYEDLEYAKKTGEALKEQLSVAERNIVLTEGPCDQKIFSAIQDILGLQSRLNIMSAGGTDPLATFMAGIKKAKLFPRKVVGFVDCDKAGLDAIKKSGANDVGCVLEEKAYIFQIPFNEHQETLIQDGIEIKLFSWGIEHALPENVVADAINEGFLDFKDIIKNYDGLSVNYTNQLVKKYPRIPRYYFQDVNDSCKSAFANWLSSKNSLAYFGALVDFFIEKTNCIITEPV